MSAPALLSLDEASVWSGVGVDELKRLADADALPVADDNHGHPLFDPRVIDALAEDRRRRRVAGRG